MLLLEGLLVLEALHLCIELALRLHTLHHIGAHTSRACTRSHLLLLLRIVHHLLLLGLHLHLHHVLLLGVGGHACLEHWIRHKFRLITLRILLLRVVLI